MMVRRKGRCSTAFFVLFAALSWPAAFPAYAQAVRSGPVEARLAVEDLSVQPGRPFWAALHLAIDREWHVYWKNPGDSGLPTTVDWILPPDSPRARSSGPFRRDS